MSLFVWVLLGLVAGFIASHLVNHHGEGIVLDALLGSRQIYVHEAGSVGGGRQGGNLEGIERFARIAIGEFG